MVVRTNKRKLFKVGNSTVLSIPPDFLKINNLERGDHVEVAWLDTVLRVVPITSSGKGNEVENTEGKLIEELEQRR